MSFDWKRGSVKELSDISSIAFENTIPGATLTIGRDLSDTNKSLSIQIGPRPTFIQYRLGMTRPLPISVGQILKGEYRVLEHDGTKVEEEIKEIEFEVVTFSTVSIRLKIPENSKIYNFAPAFLTPLNLKNAGGDVNVTLSSSTLIAYLDEFGFEIDNNLVYTVNGAWNESNVFYFSAPGGTAFINTGQIIELTIEDKNLEAIKRFNRGFWPIAEQADYPMPENIDPFADWSASLEAVEEGFENSWQRQALEQRFEKIFSRDIPFLENESA